MNKQYLLSETKGIDPKGRTITAWASRADVVDRDGELITAEAWKHPDSTAAFEENPVLMAFHRYDALPLGRVTELDKNKKGLAFTAVFAKTAAAVEAFDFIRDMGGMASFSVGFIPRSSRDMSVSELRRLGVDTAGAKGERVRVYDHAELLEISLAPVPANPRATALGRAMLDGKIKGADLRAALDPWKLEIESYNVDRTVKAAVAKALAETDISGLVAAELRAKKNDAIREEFRKDIMADYRAKREADKRESARKLRSTRMNARGFNPDDPEQVEEFVVSQLEGIDFVKLTEEQSRIAVDRARGRVY